MTIFGGDTRIQRGSLLPLLLLFLAYSGRLRADEQPACPLIRSISYQRLDVFGDLDTTRFYHRLFQKMHHTTQASVVKRELLFATGDCLDTVLLAETERNLRRLGIFADAYIEVHKDPKTDAVDLIVTTIDRFTLRINLGVSRKGGLNKFRGSLGESNFLGTHTNLHYTFEDRSDGSRVGRAVVQSNRLFGNYQVRAQYSDTDEGSYREISLGKPFWSLEDRFSWRLAGVVDHTRADYYRDGAQLTEIDNDLSSLHARLQWSLGNRNLVGRPWLDVAYEKRAYGTAPANIQVPQPFSAVPIMIGWQWQQRQNFVERTGVDSLILREDIALTTTLSLGLGARFHDARQQETHGRLFLALDQVAAPGPRQLMAWRLRGETRIHAGEKRASTWHGFYHHYLFTTHAQSWVAGLVFDYRDIYDDLYLPLTLGEDRGLRGYDAFAFTGNKRALLNLEHRWVYPWRPRGTALGQAIFVDGGGAWKRGRAPDSENLHWSAGWGLRLDIPALFGKKVLRLDVAFPLDGGDPLFSFSAGHVFSHDQVNQGFDRDF